MSGGMSSGGSPTVTQTFKSANQTITSAATSDVTDLTRTLPNTGNPCLVLVEIIWSSPTVGAAIIPVINDNGADVTNTKCATHESIATYQSVTTMIYKAVASGQIVKVRVNAAGGDITVYGNGTNSISSILVIEF